MLVQYVLEHLFLGNSVAEFDRDLDRYFIQNGAFISLIKDRADIVAGDKGTGKTAIYQFLDSQYASIPELMNIEIMSGFNPSGDPVFQRLSQTGVLSEHLYITIWKIYILSLAGNWLLQVAEGDYGQKTRALYEMLTSRGLYSGDDNPTKIFARLVSWTKRLLNPKSVGIETSIDEMGNPVFQPRIEFGDVEQPSDLDIETIPHNEALILLNEALAETGIVLWVVLDRLDEAFISLPDIEVPALRALLRTYLDLLAHDRLALKLFIRKDLSRKIVDGRFVNLTHLSARRVDISWEEDDLKSLLCQRVNACAEFLTAMGVDGLNEEEVLGKLFAPKMSSGAKQPSTWNWILSHIRDGNDVCSPRNLIDLVNKAIQEQIRREYRKPRSYLPEIALIEPESLQLAYEQLSEMRVVDTLLAEVDSDLAVLVKSLEDGKTEHNDASLGNLFGVGEVHVQTYAQALMDIGLFARNGRSYKIPILYRHGLRIKRGKAF